MTEYRSKTRLITLITAILCAAALLSGCHKRDELTGKWNMVGLSKSYTEFKSNGQYEIVMYSSELAGGMENMYDELGVELPETSEQKGKYTLEGDTITLIDSKNSDQVVIMVLDGDRILSENEVVLIRQGSL